MLGHKDRLRKYSRPRRFGVVGAMTTCGTVGTLRVVEPRARLLIDTLHAGYPANIWIHFHPNSGQDGCSPRLPS